MRFARYERQGQPAYGLIEDDRITPISAPPWESWHRAGAAVALAGVRLLVPVVPGTFYAAGLNYPEHVREYARKRGIAPELPKRAEIGYRANNALVAHDEAVVLPPDTDTVEYEGEIVVVIGKRAKHVHYADALECVFGYTIGNDISERAWQKIDRTFWRCKNADTFKPMGPWIETEVKLDTLQTKVRVNGVTTIEFPTNSMLFGIAEFISTMTQYITLHPGDVIWMGTEGKSPPLHAGDVVEVEISSIGTLRNRIVASSPHSS